MNGLNYGARKYSRKNEALSQSVDVSGSFNTINMI